MAARFHNGSPHDYGHALDTPLFDAYVRRMARACPTTIVPTPKHVHAGLKEWARATGGGRPPRFVTMDTFVREAYAEVQPAVRLFTVVDCALFLELAAVRLGVDLRTMDVDVTKIITWKREGYTPERLMEAATDEFAPRGMRAMVAVARLWRTYEEVKGTSGADIADAYWWMHLALPHSTAVRGGVVVWGVQRDTPADYHVLNAMRTADTSVDVVTTDSYDEREVLRWVNDGWQYHDGTARSRAYETRHAMPATRRDEARRIVAGIKGLLADGTLEPHDVCIVNLGSQPTMQAVEDAAADAQLPLAYEARRTLASANGALAVHAACALVARGWRRADLERLLRTGLVAHGEYHVHDLVDAARQHRIQGGRGAEDWDDRFVRRMAELADVTADDPRSIEELQEQLGRARQVLRWLRSLFPGHLHAETMLSAVDFRAVLHDTILRDLGVAHATGVAHADAEHRQIASHERAALQMLETITDRYALLQRRHGDAPRRFADHMNYWWGMVKGTTLPALERRRGIPVMTPGECIGRTWKAVFVPGLIDGEFPRYDVDATDIHELGDLADLQVRHQVEGVRDAVADGGLLMLTCPLTADDTETVSSNAFGAMGSVAAATLPDFDPSATVVLSANDRTVLDRIPYDWADDQRGIVIDADSSAGARTYHERATTRPLSPTALDIYRACPYRYFVQRILRIDATTHADDRLSGLERGNILHTVAKLFFDEQRRVPLPRELTQDGLLASAIRLDVGRRHEYLHRLHELYLRQVALFDAGHTYSPVEQRAMLGTPAFAGLLERWLENEFVEQEAGLLPVLFELDVETRIGHQPVKLRIDRVDAGMNADGTLEFRVVDYKLSSSAVPALKAVRDGRATQMPMYAEAVRLWFLERGIDAAPVAAQYHTFGRNLRSDDDPKIAVRLKDSDKTSMMEQVGRILAEVLPDAQRMHADAYPVMPTASACARCSASGVCRIQTRGIQAHI